MVALLGQFKPAAVGLVEPGVLALRGDLADDRRVEGGRRRLAVRLPQTLGEHPLDHLLAPQRAAGGGLQNLDGTVQVQPAAIGGLPVVSTGSLSDNQWHHVAVTYDQAGSTLGLYVDGVSVSANAAEPNWVWELGQPIALGAADNLAWQPYNGLLDDVRFYSQVLTDSDIASAYRTNALANPAALVARYNFDSAPSRGVTLRWLCPDAILQSADSANGPYTDLPAARSPYPTAAQKAKKFYRYYGHRPATVISNPYLM